MIIEIKTITDKNTKKYGYVMNINHANKTTTDLKLYHANDFFDVNKKSAQIQGIISSLKMALKIKPDELDLYVEDNCFINYTDGKAKPRSYLTLQAVSLYKACIKKNIKINIKTSEGLNYESKYNITKNF